MPDIGDFKDVPIIEVSVKPGDTVKPEQPLITLESDKASMEVPSPFGGVVAELKIKIGDRVSEGSVILTLTTEAARSTPAQSVASAATPPLAPAAPGPTVASLPAPGRTRSRCSFRYPLCRSVGAKACARTRHRSAPGQGQR